MENVVKMPVDLLQLPPCRKLSAAVGELAATYVWFLTWCELLYRMQDGGAPGRVSRGEFDGFARGVFDKCAVGGDRWETVAQTYRDALFRQDGDEWVCLRFIALHAGVSPSPRSMAQRGGDMRAYSMRMRESQGDAFQQSLAIAETKFIDGDGNPLDRETVKRVTWLVIACDNALFKPQRPAFAFTEGLIQSALLVAQKHSDDEINTICRMVAANRAHPRLHGMTTEKLLQEFGAHASALSSGKS